MWCNLFHYNWNFSLGAEPIYFHLAHVMFVLMASILIFAYSNFDDCWTVLNKHICIGQCFWSLLLPLKEWIPINAIIILIVLKLKIFRLMNLNVSLLMMSAFTLQFCIFLHYWSTYSFLAVSYIYFMYLLFI